MRFIAASEEEMIDVGYKIGERLKVGDIVSLVGELGVGKTTLTKGIAKAIGVTKLVNSPTFTIMKIYQGKTTLYHMDLYRLSEDSDDFDLEEYFYMEGITVIEWANNIKSIIPSNSIEINIRLLDNNEREVSYGATIC